MTKEERFEKWRARKEAKNARKGARKSVEGQTIQEGAGVMNGEEVKANMKVEGR